MKKILLSILFYTSILSRDKDFKVKDFQLVSNFKQNLTWIIHHLRICPLLDTILKSTLKQQTNEKFNLNRLDYSIMF